MKQLKLMVLDINLQLSNAIANDDLKQAQILRYQLDLLIDQMIVVMRSKETTPTH